MTEYTCVWWCTLDYSPRGCGCLLLLPIKPHFIFSLQPPPLLSQMGRSPCCSKEGLKRGPWSAKEDALLSNYILLNGEGQWRSLPTKAGLLRCGKSCRLRWMNYLRPGIKRGNISADEEDLIVRLHGLLGNRWSLIAGRLPGRTDNEIKNYWNTHLLKKLAHSPKPPAIPNDRSSAADRNSKKKKKPKPPPAAAAEEKGQNNDDEMVEGEVGEKAVAVKTKVYSPTPMRISPAFSRTTATTSSYGSSSSSDKAASATAAPEVASYDWPPLFGGFCVDEKEDDDGFLGASGSILPLLQLQLDSVAGDDMLLDRVYDEYLQLL